jgi:polar amino acid transport system permease protein
MPPDSDTAAELTVTPEGATASATAGPPPPIDAIPARHPGRWIAAAVALGVAGWLAYLMATNDNIDWAIVQGYLTASAILHGLAVTVALTVASMAVGVVLGAVFAVMRMSDNPVLSTLSLVYAWFFRGTPVLVQIIFWFNLALLFPHIGIGGLDVSTNTLITPFVAALLALGLNEGAYMAEIVRAGILAIDPGQSEAAHALGLTRGQTMRRVVLPQAMRVIIPPTGNEAISMLKLTSLVSVIAAQDLLTHAQEIYSRNYLVIELLIVVSIWYLVLTSIASVAQHYLERHYARGTGRPTQRTLLERMGRNLRPGRGRVA